MAFIFVSYRREDSEHASDRIYETLVERFGASETFKDVDAIPLGPDFREVLTKAINDSDVLLALIGDRWLSVQGPNGIRRLDDEDDFVRIEIEGALSRGKTVIPLLVGRAPMPKPEDLAPSLQGLAYRNGMPIRAGRDFRHDMDRLIHQLESIRTATEVTPAPTDTDDGDVLERWRQKKASIEQRQAQVQVLVAEHQDYAQAVELLESIPPRLRDENLFQSLSERRDRVLELDREVRRAVDAMDLDGLRPKVAELQALKPQRRDLPQLFDMLSLHEQARCIIEDTHDYAMAVSILNKLPEELRDPELYPKVVSLNERILHLENEIETNRQAGKLSDVQRHVVSLLEILPHRNDLVHLRDSIAHHQQAADLFNQKHDSSGALRLLAAVPADIRDSRLYESVKRHRRMEELENEIGQHIDSGRILGLGSKIEELSTLDPDSETVRHLADVIEKNEEAHRLIEQDRNVSAAAEVLNRIPADRRDRELSCKVAAAEHRMTKLREDRITKLRADFLKRFSIGATTALSPILRELSALTTREEEVRRLSELAPDVESLAISWRRASADHDYPLAVKLLDRLPEYLRDSKIYRALVDARDRTLILEKVIRDAIRQRSFLNLRADLDAFLELCPEHSEFSSLQKVISVNEEAMAMFPAKGRIRRILADLERVLKSIPSEMYDTQICEVREELRGMIERRVARSRRFLLTELIVVLLAGSGFGLAYGRSLTGIEGSYALIVLGMVATLVLLSPVILLTLIGYMRGRFVLGQKLWPGISAGRSGQDKIRARTG